MCLLPGLYTNSRRIERSRYARMPPLCGFRLFCTERVRWQCTHDLSFCTVPQSMELDFSIVLVKAEGLYSNLPF
ncbi:hypothetical protein M3J07_002663 [Ascochyta lentis]